MDLRHWLWAALGWAACLSGAGGGEVAEDAPPPEAEEVVAPEPRRGPLEIRDIAILSQPRMTLPAVSPDTLGRGETWVRGSFLWGNSFGWVQDSPGENPVLRDFLIDGETRTFELVAKTGVLADLDVGLRIPIHWRGGGVADSIIDDFHQATEGIGFKDNGRRFFVNDQFRVEGFTQSGEAFSLNDELGTGLGDLEFESKYRLLDGGPDGWSVAGVARLGVPTGTGPYRTRSVSGGLQVAIAKRLLRSLDFFVGGGGTGFSNTELEQIEYSTFRGQAFTAFEWRPLQPWSLIIQTDYSTRLVENIRSFGRHHWMVHLGSKFELTRWLDFELAITENIVDLEITTDFAIVAGLTVKLPAWGGDP